MYEDEKRKNDNLAGQYVQAGFGNRIAAYIIDSIILSIFGGIFVGMTGRGESFAVSLLISFLYYWYFWTQRDGQTPGKSVVGIRIIKVNGAPMTAADVILRMFGYWFSGICFGLGFLWAAFDSKGQAWHDKIANTYVIEAAPEKKKKVMAV